MISRLHSVSIHHRPTPENPLGRIEYRATTGTMPEILEGLKHFPLGAVTVRPVQGKRECPADWLPFIRGGSEQENVSGQFPSRGGS